MRLNSLKKPEMTTADKMNPQHKYKRLLPVLMAAAPEAKAIKMTVQPKPVNLGFEGERKNKLRIFRKYLDAWVITVAPEFAQEFLR